MTTATTAITATGAIVTTADRRRIELDAEAAGRVLLELPHEKYREVVSDQRVLEVLGGRNEFERGLQRRLIRKLAARERPGRKRALIVGDSIRMRQADTTGYGRHAYRRLLDDVNLTHIPHNTSSTELVLKFLDNWLGCRPDIVHINAGLHDLKIMERPEKGHGVLNTPDQYATNLNGIIDIIVAHDIPHVMWALCTPVHDAWHARNVTTGEARTKIRYNRTVMEYNDVARSVMSDRGIEVTDMFQPLMDAGLETCLLADGCHLSHRGSAIVGEIVADQVRRFA